MCGTRSGGRTTTARVGGAACRAACGALAAACGWCQHAPALVVASTRVCSGPGPPWLTLRPLPPCCCPPPHYRLACSHSPLLSRARPQAGASSTQTSGRSGSTMAARRSSGGTSGRRRSRMGGAARRWVGVGVGQAGRVQHRVARWQSQCWGPAAKSGSCKQGAAPSCCGYQLFCHQLCGCHLGAGRDVERGCGRGAVQPVVGGEPPGRPGGAEVWQEQHG